MSYYEVEDNQETTSAGYRRVVMNLGPQHPAMHGTLRVVAELEGEYIVNSTPEIGYLHSGFEKQAEHMTYNQFITVTDRMNYMSPLANNIGFVEAVEKLMNIEVTPRCKYIRVILAELARIADHSTNVGLQGMDLGAFSAMLYAFKEREKLYDIFELACGARFTTSYTRVGGLLRDVPQEFVPAVKNFLDEFENFCSEINKLLTFNKIFQQRTKDIGILSKEDAIKLGVTGPTLRASNVYWDVRRGIPYLCYPDLDFNVIVEKNGDVYDRYIVRLKEMRESMKIIRQCIEKLPAGEVNVLNSKITLPPKTEVYTKMESLIHHFKLIMEGHGLKPPVGEIYSATETPNGELGFYIVSDGSGKPYRLRIRAPSFVNYQAFPTIIRGRLIADVVAILSSLNIIAGELDR